MDCESNTCYLTLCRLCLSEPGMCTIHEINNLPHELPQKICNNCYNIIKNAIDFRELATKNDLHLKSVCGNSKTETFNEDFVSSTITNNYYTSKYFDQEEQDKEIQRVNDPDKKMEVPVKLHTISIRKDLFPTSTQPLCDEKHNANSSAKIRLKKSDSTEVLEYRCDVCCRNFETWKKLYLHTRLHNKNIECPIDFCGKMFATKGDLEKHVRTHTGEKPYKCDICQRKFAQKGTLKSHKETVHRDDE